MLTGLQAAAARRQQAARQTMMAGTRAAQPLHKPGLGDRLSRSFRLCAEGNGKGALDIFSRGDLQQPLQSFELTLQQSQIEPHWGCTDGVPFVVLCHGGAWLYRGRREASDAQAGLCIVHPLSGSVYSVNLPAQEGNFQARLWVDCARLLVHHKDVGQVETFSVLSSTGQALHSLQAPVSLRIPYVFLAPGTAGDAVMFKDLFDYSSPTWLWRFGHELQVLCREASCQVGWAYPAATGVAVMCGSGLVSLRGPSGQVVIPDFRPDLATLRQVVWGASLAVIGHSHVRSAYLVCDTLQTYTAQEGGGMALQHAAGAGDRYFDGDIFELSGDGRVVATFSGRLDAEGEMVLADHLALFELSSGRLIEYSLAALESAGRWGFLRFSADSTSVLVSDQNCESSLLFDFA